MPKKILQVNSHQRSGTHLLLEGLSRHFYPQMDLLFTAGNKRNWAYSNGITTSKKKGISVKGGKLFSSHDFPENCKWSKDNTIYIRRDGFDVLHSFYKLRTYAMEKKPSFDQWLTKERIKHWVLHISKWMKTGVYVVQFEHLSTNYEDQMSMIATFLGFRTQQMDTQNQVPLDGIRARGLSGMEKSTGAKKKGRCSRSSRNSSRWIDCQLELKA